LLLCGGDMQLQTTGLTKHFPGVVALDGVSIRVPRGQVVALVGANGAGKSTLIKILTGYYDDYDGEISVDGDPVRLTSPALAFAAGIRAVYQEVDTALIPSMTVTENILIEGIAGQKHGSFINWAALHREAEQILARIGLSLDVRGRVQELPLHSKQMLLIARAVFRNAGYLIFDEPTTSLSEPEIERLFAAIGELKARGLGIIYISHRLEEVRTLADQIVILRNGQKVADFPAAQFDMAHVTEAMLGAPITQVYPPKTPFRADTPTLEVRGGTRKGVLHDIHLQAYRGEILGVTGLVGAGKTELLRAIYGAEPFEAGDVLIDGERVAIRTPGAAFKHGIYLTPEERRAQGVFIDDSVQKNLSLPFLSQFAALGGWMRTLRERAHAVDVIGQVGLVPGEPGMRVGTLSGGNQQKVAIGKWIGGSPRVMLFDEASQGIDMRAKHDIYGLVRNLSKNSAVIYSSSDIDEVLGLADRVLVMRDGRIVAEFAGKSENRAGILDYATGSR
jgi:simple sugar transport system ATP-binding protein